MGTLAKNVVLAILAVSCFALLVPGAAGASTQPPVGNRGGTTHPAAADVGVGPMDSPGLLVRLGLVVPVGGAGGFDDLQAGYPSVIVDGGAYRMWYFGCNFASYCQIGYATSSDGESWTKAGPVLSPSLPAEGQVVAYPTVVRVGPTYWMWYNGYDGFSYRILAATSADGVNWTKHGVVLDVGTEGSPDAFAAGYPRAIFGSGGYALYYTGISSPTSTTAVIMRATSTDGLVWAKQGIVLSPGPPGSMDSDTVSASSVAVVESMYEMIYTGAAGGVGRLMYAESPDGIVWTRRGVALNPEPPSEGGIHYANFLVAPGGTWSVWYTARGGSWDLQIYFAVSDTSPPVTTAVLQGVAGTNGWYTSPVTVSLSAEDDLAGVLRINYTLDSIVWTVYAAPFVLGDGIYTLFYAAVDKSGNQEIAKSLQVKVDATPPSVQITSPSGNVSISEVPISWTGTDSTSGIVVFEISVDSGAFRSVGTNTTDRLVLADGKHTVRIRAFDAAGNVAIYEVRFSIDTNLFRLRSPFWGYLTIAALAATAGVVAFIVWRDVRRARPPPGQ